MKRLILIMIATVMFAPLPAFAGQGVKKYQKKDGTYVQKHYRSSPDRYRYNNRNSRSNGGHQRDEYSSGFGATNKRNSSYDWRDNSTQIRQSAPVLGV